jgi:pimeloyl-ACP methyl ester carboxylesterase
MATLERDGVAIHYDDHGEGEAILLTHGYSATGQMWSGQVEALAADYRLISWDLRGHGRSDSPDDLEAYREAAAVEDMAALLDACGVARAVIGGLSLGGYLSLAFHAVHPERVRALLLFDTGPGYKKGSAREGWNQTSEATARRFEERGLEALGRGDEVRISTHRSAKGLALAARGTLKQFDARVIESLPEIRVPTLVLAGEDDRPFLAATDYMAAKIPGAEKVILAGAGHAANIQQPEAFNKAVRSFLERRLG